MDTADRKLVLLIRRRIPDLSPKEIAASIRRLDIRIEAPESPYEPSKGPKRTLASRSVNKPEKKKGEQDQPERRRLRLEFWQGLLSRPTVKTSRHAGLAPVKYGWIAAGSGVGGLPFVYAVKQEEGRVELFIDRGPGKAETNKRIFDWLEKRKEDIERAFGGKLSWERLEGKQGCRVAYTLTGGGYRSDESKWPVIQDGMIEAMIRLEKALTPHLEKLKTELESDGG